MTFWTRILTFGCTPKPVNFIMPPTRIAAQDDALPVYDDITWLGCTMTLPNGGIVNRGTVTDPNHLSL